MPKRTCCSCGEEKDIYKGKICEKKGHFVCRDCAYDNSSIFTVREKYYCPVCNSKLQ